ncbi:L-type lectin-domain containing receptor kinase SIT2-like [Oryza brachyantha]|uniref:non-specific serine/threonine protein kinase n=1 Tax=Oryza brachyantha TaxID=4533 RepID=J3NAV6_ORYBR|nr:L-type lectin-domain containing receptor kinase SIT2-like [Oryza brachyantha]
MAKKNTSVALAPSIALIHLAMLLFLVCCTDSSSVADFLFNSFEQASNLSLDGSALVLRSGALQLTDGNNNVMGHAFLDTPVRMVGINKMAVSFSTCFVFDIVATGTGGGYGLAFVVAPSKVLPGASREDYLGILGPSTNGRSSNHVFAIEFDTVLSVQGFNDTNYNHVGVDINSLVSNVSEPAAYYTDDDKKKVAVKLESAQPIQAWVDYDGGAHVLNVTIAPAALSTHKPHRPLISARLDLSTVFRESMYIGFSSATGKLASSHYILAWSFRSEGAAQDIDLSRLPDVPKPRPPARGRSTPRSAIIRIAAPACAGTLFSMAMVMVGVLWLRRKAALAETLEDWEVNHPHRFPYKDLHRATKGFSDSQLIGQGGFGQVYKGVLHGASDVVAIKRISSNAGQGMREFVAEIASLGRVRHRNLVELRGWCKRGQDLLLVYEFMPNGSLDAILFGKGTREREEEEEEAPTTTTTLTWAQRLHILKGVAFGLVYLHEEWEHVVVHRDVKASNVLLGADMGARLGDFGLARLYEHGADPVTTHVVGTIGYMAPEMAVTSRPTTATDVFAFGALLLEVTCGRRPTSAGGGGGTHNLVSWVRHCGFHGQFLRAVDPRLHGSYDEEEVTLVLWLGLMCSHSIPEARPSMRQVCNYLNGDETLQPDDSLLLSSTDHSAQLFGPPISMTWTSCGSMSADSLPSGR